MAISSVGATRMAIATSKRQQARPVQPSRTTMSQWWTLPGLGRHRDANLSRLRLEVVARR